MLLHTFRHWLGHSTIAQTNPSLAGTAQTQHDAMAADEARRVIVQPCTTEDETGLGDSATMRSAALFQGDDVAGDGNAYYPPQDATTGEGAFINTSGGLTIYLVPGTTAGRALGLIFGTPAGTDYDTCGRNVASVQSTNLILQMNVSDAAGNPLGLASLATVGATNSHALAKINFYSGLNDGYFRTLRFTAIKITRTSLNPATWTIESAGTDAATAVLQCTTIQRPTRIAEDSVWHMPFQITVTANQGPG